MFCSHCPRISKISKVKDALISVDKGEDGDDNGGDDDDGGDDQ